MTTQDNKISFPKIDIVIISYNRSNDLYLLLLELIECDYNFEKIIVFDNNSSDDTISNISKIKSDKIILVHSLVNLGVAAGRNEAIKYSSADLSLFLDDDVTFDGEDFNLILMGCKDRFLKDSALGAISFNITNFHTKQILKKEYPFTGKINTSDFERKCSYYIGAGHIIRRKLFLKLGGYPVDFFYGMEELDFSIRLINENFYIIYVPQFRIYHKQNPMGRLPSSVVFSHVLYNRLVIGYKYYPYFNFFIASLLWGIKILFISKSFTVPFNALSKFIKSMNKIERNKMSEKTLKYLKINRGRVWY